MAPSAIVTLLAKRDYTRCDSNGYCRQYYTSTWDDWGRWAALGAIVFFFLFIAFLWSCINNRRRRRRGMQPMNGTGWMPFAGPKPPQGQQNSGYYQNAPYNGGHPAPPMYSPPIGNQATGNTFNSNDGYYGNHGAGGYNPYGGQQSGIELQQPTGTYQPQGQRDVYEAPMGPPPGKNDGIIR